MDRQELATTRYELDTYLNNKQKVLTQHIQDAHSQIQRINGLTLRDEGKERQTALAPATRSLIHAQQQYDAIRQEHSSGWLSWMTSPQRTYKAYSLWKEAKDVLAEACDTFDEPTLRAMRLQKIAEHNQYVANQRDCLDLLKTTLGELRLQHKQLEDFRIAATDSFMATTADGWLAPNFAENFIRISGLVQGGELQKANQFLTTLAFQKRPPSATYRQWQSQAQAIRNKALQSYVGMAITGTFPEIASASASLAAGCMRPGLAERLNSNLHPSDQWQLLTSLATIPENFKVDALWAIYWAMFQCAQEMAEFMDQTRSQEDPLNGRFSAYLEKWLSPWAAQLIPQFGYPRSTAYLGTLQLAGTTEETRLGADLGVIISLDIGPLKCRKVALLQAKRAKAGIANIGSDKGQLPTLSDRPRVGYYLFHHESPDPAIHPPAPTVSAAQALLQRATTENKNPQARYISQDVRKSGWDWASFISFGLCNAQSDLGETFDTVEDALRILGDGNSGNLPQYVHLVAIEDDAYVRQLRQRLHISRYTDIARGHDLNHGQRRGKGRQISRDGDPGFEHGL